MLKATKPRAPPPPLPCALTNRQSAAYPESKQKGPTEPSASFRRQSRVSDDLLLLMPFLLLGRRLRWITAALDGGSGGKVEPVAQGTGGQLPERVESVGVAELDAGMLEHRFELGEARLVDGRQEVMQPVVVKGHKQHLGGQAEARDGVVLRGQQHVRAEVDGPWGEPVGVLGSGPVSNGQPESTSFQP